MPVLLFVFAFLQLSAPSPDPSVQPDDDEQTSTIVGRVIDAETHDPLPGAAVRLREIGRARVTDASGSFRFEEVPIRRLTVSVQFLGFAPEERQVLPRPDETISVTIELQPSVLELQDVVITGTGRERGVADTYQPTAVLSGAELQRNLQTSLSASIEHLPGLSQRYNGPVASQPAIRGMSGDRVLILEDGQRTGDMSTTAADHAVSLDPLSAERIEVVRGPAGLLYGSNALGGVINVIRQDVPRSMPGRLSGTFSAVGETVNRGGGGNLSLAVPVGTFALRGELNGRSAGDTRTPLGVLGSTGMQSYSGGLGVSMIRRWGHVGVSGRLQDLDYGIPGEFNGELIPGAHPGGVDAETQRRTFRFSAAHLDFPGFFSTAEIDANLNHYIHDEIEGTTETGRRIVGAHFDQLSGSGNMSLRHEHDLHGHGENYLRVEGAMGVSGFGRDLVTNRNSGTRPASEMALAGFVFEEFSHANLRFQLGARYDWHRITPKNDDPILVAGRSIPVAERDFGAVSGSASILYDITPRWTAGINLARAFRTPAIEELFSDGPHLADFSFNIGNPELPAEIGNGMDLFLRSSRQRLQFEASAFLNRISDYIYYRPTGELDPRQRRLPVYQATSDDAVFVGADGRVQWEFADNLVADATLSYVRATRLEDDDPLPAIPPLNGHLSLRYETRQLFASIGASAAAPQNRVPRASADMSGPLRTDSPTDGYGLLNAGIGYRFDRGGMLHTVSLQGNNLTNAVWRDHLSRIKEVAPQPGRNLQLAYRIQF